MIITPSVEPWCISRSVCTVVIMALRRNNITLITILITAISMQYCMAPWQS